MKAIKFGMLIALAVTSASAFAAPNRYIQAYTGQDYVDQQQANNIDPLTIGPAVTKDMTTTANVLSYLYIKGNLGASFTIDGWGSGSFSQTENVDIYHNEYLTLSFSGFADLNNPTPGAGQANLPTKFQFQAVRGDDIPFRTPGQVLSDTTLVNGTTLNGTSLVIDPSEYPTNVPPTSGGHAVLKITRELDPVAANGPGTYSNTGVLTITRS
jgi:hypothetical protein